MQLSRLKQAVQKSQQMASFNLFHTYLGGIWLCALLLSLNLNTCTAVVRHKLISFALILRQVTILASCGVAFR